MATDDPPSGKKPIAPRPAPPRPGPRAPGAPATRPPPAPPTGKRESTMEVLLGDLAEDVAETLPPLVVGSAEPSGPVAVLEATPIAPSPSAPTPPPRPSAPPAGPMSAPTPVTTTPSMPPPTPMQVTTHTPSRPPPPPSPGGRQATPSRPPTGSVAIATPPAPPAARAPGPMPAPPPPSAQGALAQPVQAPPPAPTDPAVEDARTLVRTCEAELATTTDLLRAARLHYEIARLCESPLGDFRRAAAHYQEAFSRAPEHLPTIRGARRVLIARKSFQQALPLFDAEARISADPHKKAALLYAKGRLLEDVLGQKTEARDAYAAALDLDRSDPAILKAMEQCESQAESWDALERTYERSANAVAGDPRHRAALIVARARLVEARHGQIESAIQLYETALRLDPLAPGALDALKRLHHGQKRWRDLIGVLELEVDQSTDSRVRGTALYQIGRLHAERLGNREEATNALERAAQELPDDPLVLDGLANLYEVSERWDTLVLVLERLAEGAREPAERLGLLHRLGQLYEERLREEDTAVRWYEAALAIEPTFVPGLQALGKLYAKRTDWNALVAMHLAEAEATDDTRRRAAAHCRIAEILEISLERAPDAMEHYARALALVPGYAPAFKALTRLYATASMHRELIELYERAIDGAPDNDRSIAYLFKIGAIFEDHVGEPGQAAHTYRRVLDLDADHLGAIHALQRATERAGRYQELVDALELEAEKTRDQETVVALLHQAGEILDEKLGDRDGALVRFRRVLAANPTYVPALTSLGRIYYRTGRWEDLLDMYRRELEVTPRGPGAVALLLKMGELSEERVGRDDDSLAFYRRAIDIDPTCGPALRALARKLRERRAWAELVQVLELELSGLSDPAARATAGYRLGEVCEEQLAQPDRAIQAYEQALRSEHDHRAAAEALMRLRAERKSFGKLAEDLAREVATATDPRQAIAALLREGELWSEELKEPRRAITCFETILQRDPTNLGAMLELEPLYRRVGAWESLARVHALQARVFTDPGARIAALRELARLQETRSVGGLSELRATYEAILSLAPHDSGALAALERIALETGEHRLLVHVYARLAEASEDAPLQAAYQTRLAEALEAAGDPGAIGAYRLALTQDPEGLAAMRGLSRLAERMNDPVALAEAARREAGAARSGEAAARAFVRSAIVRSERLGDMQGAQADLERALELAPEDAEAAERLGALLLGSGQIARLVDLLSRAAGSAKSPERVAALWMEVARLHADVLDNVAGAIGALNRVLRTSPNHVVTLVKLAQLYGRDGQWTEAANLLGRVVQLAPDRDLLRDAHLELASIWDERLGETSRALVSLQAVLALDAENPQALSRLADLQARDGDLEKAVETAKRLVRVSTDARDRAPCLTKLARLERKRGGFEAMALALREAVAIEGPLGAAGAEFRQLASEQGGVDRYAAAIVEFLSASPTGGARLAPTYLELARVQDDELGRPDDGLATLARGIAACGPEPLLRVDLATRLRKARRYAESLDELRRLLLVDVARGPTWRDIARTFQEMGKPEDAATALSALAVLGAATAEEQVALRARPARTSAIRHASLDAEALRAFGSGLRQEPAAEELLVAVGEAVCKLYPIDLESFGLSTRDRLTQRTGAPIRGLADRLAGIFGVPEFELYVHRVRSRGVAIEPSLPPTVLVPAALLELPESQQVFALSRALANIARRVHPVDKLTPRELEILLASAARNVSPGFGTGLTSEDFLDDHANRIKKALSRRARSALQEAATRYVTAGPVDFPAWTRAVQQTAARAALLVSDDLPGALELSRRSERELAGVDMVTLAQASEPVADLLRFWISDAALALRRRTGIIAGG